VGGAARRFLVLTAVAGFGLPAGLRAAPLLSPSLGLLAWSSLVGVIEVCVRAADLLLVAPPPLFFASLNGVRDAVTHARITFFMLVDTAAASKSDTDTHRPGAPPVDG